MAVRRRGGAAGPGSPGCWPGVSAAWL